ncbi:hypothetical protein [Pelagicoccus sp. SDUM812002]|uniref:hypothetical protein n=1 Tax=Pelagicoccus sp. SDUM812002 TaxID=3041266 RepID=UPI00280DBAD1|nr:hypothetical protein [Pelagicoccus sp. SDUM812002]MDQ8187678.1 hypothetical protein [Pelagicoccus sp. SDUM812002]
MLYAYKYISHSLETLQTYLDHLVLEVWCKADEAYSLDLLHPKLKEIVLDFYYDDAIEKDYLDGPIKTIYALFQDLSADQRNAIATAYRTNNDIESLCSDCNGCKPATYSSITAISSRLSAELRKFYKSLFTEVIHRKAVYSRLGSLDEHFNEFRKVNKHSYCPFCGLYRLKGVYHQNREAYDHFLPKATYPFNSVNFKNLAPMCHECNSTYKLAKNPLISPRNRDPIHSTDSRPRKAFYAYSETSPKVEITLELATGDIENLTPSDIELSLTSTDCDEEVSTWDDIFRIKERYKAIFCEEDDGKAWIDTILSGASSKNLTPRQLYNEFISAAEKRPFTDTNFLKKPFLEACERKSLIPS